MSYPHRKTKEKIHNLERENVRLRALIRALLRSQAQQAAVSAAAERVLSGDKEILQ